MTSYSLPLPVSQTGYHNLPTPGSFFIIPPPIKSQSEIDVFGSQASNADYADCLNDARIGFLGKFLVNHRTWGKLTSCHQYKVDDFAQFSRPPYDRFS